jgi:precorrin-2/cobalt-factor-2 C20-methyltransferase
MSAGGTGRLLGIGVGPGDPELLTLKAARLLREAPVVAHFAKAGRAGRAQATIAALLRPDVVLLPLLYPVTTEIPHHHPDYRTRIEAFFDEAAAQVAAHLDSGRDVAVTSEGDPLFYGSYMHLHARLAPRYAAEVVPGVTGMSACWSMAGVPIAQGEDVLSVLPGTLEEAELARRLRDADAAVIMKVGRNLPKIRRALAQAGLLDRAIYAERATMPEGHAMPLAARDDAPAPYFSIVLVPGWAGP